MAKEDRLFWAKVDKSGDCWLWNGEIANNGYGRVKRRPRHLGAHRYAYELAYGEFDSDLYVLHRCDVPRCVRPSHLFLGTARDNTIDMVTKQRNNPPVGERAWTSKLTEQEVVEIRRIYTSKEQTQSSIAKLFDVGQDQVSRIINKRRWQHVS